MLLTYFISIHMPNFNMDFQNFNFSTVRTVKNVELHHYAKFCRNRLNRGRDMIFRFFKTAAAAILDFRNLKFLTFVTIKRVELHHRAKFRRNHILVGLVSGDRDFKLKVSSASPRIANHPWKERETRDSREPFKILVMGHKNISCPVDRVSCCQLRWKVSVINWWRSSTSVYNTVAVWHRVAWVCQRKRRLVF